MARPLRLELPGVPLHVIQRGNNRAPCFFSDGDYRLYLDCLRAASAKCGCALHAYVLMTNHVHLLLTPREPHAVSRLMQTIGRRYVRAINDRYQRSGTLWEGRFRSSLIDSEQYFLVCQHYIELNPVRAGMVRFARDYRWSSHLHYAEGRLNPLLTEHECYVRLAETAMERRNAYRALSDGGIDPGRIETIRSSARKGLPVGSEQFKDQLEAALGCDVRPGQRGRPEKQATNSQRAQNQAPRFSRGDRDRLEKLL